VAENQLGFLPSTLRGVDAPSALGGGSIDVSINDTWALSLLSGHTQSASRVCKYVVKCKTTSALTFYIHIHFMGKLQVAAKL